MKRKGLGGLGLGSRDFWRGAGAATELCARGWSCTMITTRTEVVIVLAGEDGTCVGRERRHARARPLARSSE